MVEDKVVLQVDGMTCSNCAQGITRHLQKKGIDVFVNYEKGEVELSKEPDHSVQEIVNEINSLGYKAVEKINISQLKKYNLSPLEKRFLIAAFFTFPLMLHMFFSWQFLHNGWLQLILCLPVLYIGLTFFGKSAWGGLRNGQMNMDVLITIGACSAFIYSLFGLLIANNEMETHHYLFFETSAVIITLVLLGNIIELRSLKKTSSAVESLLLLQPLTARRILNSLTSNETTEEINISLLKKNDLVLINSGDKIPADGKIYWGDADIDESAMTGESSLSYKGINDTVLAGTLLNNGSIKVIAEAVGSNTVLNNIIEIVKRATQNKPAIQKWGDKVSAWFVPIVLLISLFTFLLSYLVFSVTLTQSILSSIAVLVISCPCAMGLATPTAVAVAVGRAANEGILIKGGQILEQFCQSRIIVFDKTGTLTEPNLKIKKVDFYQKESIARHLLITLEQYSTHPMARSILNDIKAGDNQHTLMFTAISEEKGFGVKASDKEGNNYFVGNYRWAKEITKDDTHQVYVGMNKEILATIDFEEAIRHDAKPTISYFKSKGFKTILLSGDRQKKCNVVAENLGMDEVYGEQLPTEKLGFVEQLKKTGLVIMVGDGINDSPSLAAADIGVSFGSATQTAIKTADIILMNDQQLSSLIKVHQLSKETLITIKQNLFWALIYNVIAIPIAATGMLSPMISSLSMAFSDVIVIGNSLRLKIKNIFTAQSATI